MRSSSFITTLSPSITGAAAVLLCLFLCASSVRAQAVGAADSTDPNVECTPYNYAPLTGFQSNFPPVWVQPATIVANDTEALGVWNSIKGSIPTNIPVKGTVKGDFSNFTPTYNTSDPDCWWTYDKCDTPKLPGLQPDIIDVPEPNVLGYGFDDGPNCSHNAFYDFLNENNQKATMFYIGSNVWDWPNQALRALHDGHQICCHTWSHPYLTAVDSQDLFAEIWYTLKIIKMITGITPKCFRAPYGDADDRVRSIVQAMNMTMILWRSDSNDWEVGSVAGVTPETVDGNYQALITSAQNGTFASRGTVFLTHEIDNYSMATAMKWYPMLKQAFTALVPVGVAYNVTNPYVETNYSLPSYSQYVAGELTATGSASSASASSSTHGGSTAGAIGMPTVSGGLIGTVVTVAALLGGIALLLA